MNDTPFFLAGGALAVDAPSYVEREADGRLFASLMHGEFCYVLTSRQMGKSSLMIRTAVRLRREGVSAVVLDLNALGHDLTREQWYLSLTLQMARKLNVLREVRAYWTQTEELSPLQRWVGAVQHILLHLHAGHLVIFIDEIDQVRLLPFNVDEFFAAIRSCYSRRAEDPEFDRLTFCLLGVALPSDLIGDHRMTPFNIGTRIELTDFTEEQTLGLASGLGRDEILAAALLERVYYWAHGHPYLTQRLCRAIVESPDVFTAQQLDGLCERLLLTKDAQQQDDNLTFVRDRLLKSDADLADLLSLYDRAVRGQSVRDTKANRLAEFALLSGIVSGDESRLVVRNRIYAHVFDRAWVRTQMPGTELRRQRVAFLRGALRVASIAAVMLGVVGSLAIRAINAEKRAEEAQRKTKRFLYAADINVAQQALQDDNTGYAQDLLEAQRPRPGEDDLRGFEWRFLWRLCHGDRFTLHGHTKLVYSVAYSPVGRILASGSDDGTIKLWNPAIGRKIRTLVGHHGWVRSVAFSPVSGILASGSQDGAITLWDVRTGRETKVMSGHKGLVNAIAFSPDGKRLASGSEDRTVRLWDVATARDVRTLGVSTSHVFAVAFSPDGKTLASGGGDAILRLWDVATGRVVFTSESQTDGIFTLTFSHNGKLMASGSEDGIIKLWDSTTHQELTPCTGHRFLVNSVAFSPDDRMLASASWDTTIKLWDVATGKEKITLKGHADLVNCVAFSPDGKTLASASNDHTVKLWNVEPASIVARQERVIPEGHGKTDVSIALALGSKLLGSDGADHIVKLWSLTERREIARFKERADVGSTIAISPDGERVASGGSDNTVKVWDIATRRFIATLRGHCDIIFTAFSPDSRMLASASKDSTVKFWDTATWREKTLLRGHTDHVRSVAFSPDGRLLASGSNDNTVRLWDTSTGHLVATLQGHANDINCVAFSPDGKTIASGSWDRTIMLWDLASRQRIATLRGHARNIKSLAFSPDGKTLASGSDDATLKLWNLATWQEMITFRLPGSVSSAAFTADGNSLAAGCGDGNVYLWRAATMDEVNEYEARETRR